MSDVRIALRLFVVILLSVVGAGCLPFLAREEHVAPPPSPHPPVSGELIGSWHANVRLDNKPYTWIYTFYHDGTFWDQGLTPDNQIASGGVGKYKITDDKVTIDWKSSESRELGRVAWVNPNRFRYTIVSHNDAKQVGMEIEFTRGDPPLPPKDSVQDSNTATETIQRISAGQIETLVQSFRETEGFTEVSTDTYKFNVGNLKILLFNKGGTMQLAAIFSGTSTGSRINDWNRTYRFSRAYLSNDDEPVLQSDLDLAGGVTKENIKEWMRTFVVSIKAFKSHLEE